jgi:hypothetical protein
VLQIEVLEDPVEQRERRVHLRGDLQHRTDREEEPRLQRRERHDVPGPEGVPAVAEHPSRDDVDERRGDREEDPDDGEERPSDHRLSDLQARQARVLVLETVDLVVLTAERLGQEDARDRQRLLRHGGEIRQRLLGARRDLAARAPDLDREPEEERQQ